jgi:hypothetical protein
VGVSILNRGSTALSASAGRAFSILRRIMAIGRHYNQYDQRDVKPRSIWIDNYSGVYIQVIYKILGVSSSADTAECAVCYITEFQETLTATLPDFFKQYTFVHQYPEET